MKICVPNPNMDEDDVITIVMSVVGLMLLIPGIMMIIYNELQAQIIVGAFLVFFSSVFFSIALALNDKFPLKWCDHWGIEK